jgi:hypothetical protein
MKRRVPWLCVGVLVGVGCGDGERGGGRPLQHGGSAGIGGAAGSGGRGGLNGGGATGGVAGAIAGSGSGFAGTDAGGTGAGAGGDDGFGGEAGIGESGGASNVGGSAGTAGRGVVGGTSGAAGEAGAGGEDGLSGFGGEAGESGSGAAGGLGGSAGNVGSGGNAGSGGSGGSAGSGGSGGSKGGAGGVGGSAGKGGAGGVGGSAGKGGVGGSAGKGGAGGSGGTSGGCTEVGHHVSRDTCQATECGTVQLPFCTIARGIQSSPDQRVLVAGSVGVYFEALVVPNGFEIEGGYRTDFSGGRTLSGNGSTVINGSASFGTGVTAELDGLEFLAYRLAGAPGPLPSLVAPIVVNDANVTLTNVAVNRSLTQTEWQQAAASQSYAVRALLSNAGSLRIRGGDLRAPRGSSSSTAVFVDGVGAAVIENGASLLGGPVTSASGSSTGLSRSGSGSLLVEASSIGSTTANNSRGVNASGTSGSLEFRGASRLVPANGTALSVAIDIAASSTGSVLVSSGTQVNAGSATLAAGLRHGGLGTLRVEDSMIFGGDPGSLTSYGISAGRSGYTSTDLVNASVHGGSGTTSYGLNQAAAQRLTITNSDVSGGDGTAPATSASGVRTTGVLNVDVRRSTLTGSRSPVGTGTGEARALSLHSFSNVVSSALVEDSTLDGGNFGAHRFGVWTEGMPLEVRGSTVRGAGGAGALRAHAIEAVGTFAAGSLLSIHDNPEISGGLVGDYYLGGAGVYVASASNLNVRVFDNPSIVGCPTACAGGGHGVYIGLTPGTHQIENNGSIVGGNSSNGYHQFYGVSLASAGSASVRNNGFIAGTTDPLFAAADATGLLVFSTHAAVENNEILGGFGKESALLIGNDGLAKGVRIESPTAPATVSFDDNRVTAGGALRQTRGLLVGYNVTFSATRNVVYTCPPSMTGNAAICRTGNTTAVDASLLRAPTTITNGYFFGGYGRNARACDLGSESSLHFEANLCYVVGQALNPSGQVPSTSVALRVRNVGGPQHQILNNIAHAEPVADQSRAVQWGDSRELILLANNDFLSGTCIGGNDLGGCYVTLAATEAMVAAAGGIEMVNSVSLSPGYLAPAPLQPTLAGHHQGPSCALGGLGRATLLATDYDRDARNLAQPTIGPDECQ